MGYYVIGDDGQKYGPADIATLNVWVTEGRLNQFTMLEDELSGARVAASATPGIQFAAVAPPIASPYPRPVQPSIYGASPSPYTQVSSGNNGNITLAFVLAFISPFLSFFLPIGGLFTSLWGLRVGIRARESGHPMAILSICFCGLAIGFWILTRILGLGRGMFLRY